MLRILVCKAAALCHRAPLNKPLVRKEISFKDTQFMLVCKEKIEKKQQHAVFFLLLGIIHAYIHTNIHTHVHLYTLSKTHADSDKN